MHNKRTTSHTPAGCRAEKTGLNPCSRPIDTLSVYPEHVEGHSKGLATSIQNFLTGELERQKAFGFHKPIHGLLPSFRHPEALEGKKGGLSC
jgi:hypothetical protein